MLRATTAITSLAALFFFTGIAQAEPPRVTSTEGDSSTLDGSMVERRWYGGQTLLADTISLSLVGAGIAVDPKSPSPALLASGFAGYSLTAPVIHFAHGHLGKGLADLALRVGTASLGAVIGHSIGTALHTPLSPPPAPTLGDVIAYPVVNGVNLVDAQIRGAVYGAAIGGLVAMVIDGAVLAREDVPRPGSRKMSVAMAPALGPTHGGFHAGLSGSF